MRKALSRDAAAALVLLAFVCCQVLTLLTAFPLQLHSLSEKKKREGAGRLAFASPSPSTSEKTRSGNTEVTSSLGSLSTAAAAPTYVAVCLVVKDEHAAIREWVAYHRSIGIGRFYVYDDGSQPPLEGALADSIQSGLVMYRRLDEPLREAGQAQQMAIYSDCFRQFGQQSTWLGAIDVDEFIMIMDGSPSLPAVLHRYEAYGGLVINWRIFGSSGHKTRPTGGVLQSFTKCSRPEYHANVHVKSFGNTAHVAGAGWSPHHLDYRPGYFAVNTNFTRVEGPFSEPPLSDILVINHYILRSWEEFQRKLANSTDEFPGYTKTVEFWERTERATRRECRYAVPLGARVQEELAALAAAGAKA